MFAWLLLRLVRWLARTLRVTLVGPEPDTERQHVYAFLHGSQLPLLCYPRKRNVVVLASRSRDGELQTRVLSGLGLSVVRGSSTRGGAEGLVSLVRSVRSGSDAAVAVDGPRGPAGDVKPGAIYLAQATRALIVPVTSAVRTGMKLRRAWDRFLLPPPWSQVVLRTGEAFEVPREGGGHALEIARTRLQRALVELSVEAERDLSVRGEELRRAA